MGLIQGREACITTASQGLLMRANMSGTVNQYSSPLPPDEFGTGHRNREPRFQRELLEDGRHPGIGLAIFVGAVQVLHQFGVIMLGGGNGRRR